VAISNAEHLDKSEGRHGTLYVHRPRKLHDDDFRVCGRVHDGVAHADHPCTDPACFCPEGSHDAADSVAPGDETRAVGGERNFVGAVFGIKLNLRFPIVLDDAIDLALKRLERGASVHRHLTSHR
jgi:hypothetical protein